VLALAVAVEAFLPSKILNSRVQELTRSGHGGVVGVGQECGQLLKEGTSGTTISGHPASGAKSGLKLLVGSDEEDVDQVSVFTGLRFRRVRIRRVGKKVEAVPVDRPQEEERLIGGEDPCREAGRFPVRAGQSGCDRE
jgi:hypothetical protein